MSSTFAEIRQQDATPDIAAIYGDIKTVSGLPLVNLIWRHFATFPGVLSWAWTAASPIVGSTRMDAARQRIAASLILPSIAPIGADNWRSAGVSDQELARITTVVDAYLRGNLTNMIALTALRMRLEHPNRPAARLIAGTHPAPALTHLDPLPRINSLEAHLAAQIRALAKRHEGISNDVTPSFYLALSYWPGVVEVLPTWLSALYQPGALRAARVDTCNLAEAEAETMLPQPSLPPEGISAVQPTLERFTRLLIPAFVPVCLAMRRLLPRSEKAEIDFPESSRFAKG
jgi:hypothetical protein